MKRWYVVYTKAGQERLAEGNLTAQGFETYLPFYADSHMNASPKPMFSRYLFVRLDLNEGPWRSVMSTYGVSRLIAFGSRPSFVADIVVDRIRNREDAQGVVQPLEPEALERGDSVRISGEMFDGLRGLFDSGTPSQRATVLLTLLGRTVPAHVPRHQLQRAS